MFIYYHVTSQGVLPKILRQGITPRSQSKSVYYPERVYLYTCLERACEFLYLKALVTETNKSEWVILEVDLPPGFKLYNDPNSENSCYALNTISPRLIRIIDDVKSEIDHITLDFPK